jgi:hypothetical protein
MYGRIQSKRDEHVDDKKQVADLHPGADVAPPPPDEIPDAENAAEVERSWRESSKKRTKSKKDRGG